MKKYILSIAFAALLCPVLTFAATPAIVGTPISETQSGAATTYTTSNLTVPNNGDQNTVLWVYYQEGGGNATGAHWDTAGTNQAMTVATTGPVQQLAFQTILCLPNPTTGNKTLTVNSPSADARILFAFVTKDTSQASCPIDGPNKFMSNGAAVQSSSENVTTTVNNSFSMIFMARNGSSAVTNIGSQTAIGSMVTAATGVTGVAGQLAVPTLGTTAMGWTWGLNDSYDEVAVSALYQPPTATGDPYSSNNFWDVF